MRTYLLRLGLALCVGAISLVGCQKDVSTQQDSLQDEVGSVVVPPTCGNSLTTNLQDLGGNIVGTVVISNDATNYYIKIAETLDEYDIGTVKLVYGDQAHVIANLIGLIQCGFQSPANPDLTVNYFPEQDEVLITIPIASIPLECFYFHARVTVVKRDPGTGNILYAYDIWSYGNNNASQNPCQTYYQYCRQDCPDDECGQLRTQTPGGWGAEPNGNNPGTYLHANFDASFTDLKVGCAAGFEVTLTSAQAITNLLPTGGQAAVLTADVTDPASMKNVLVGHLVALTLSVKFDYDDPDFGEAGVNLGDMIIGSGTFAGMTVNQFLVIANNVLGGCSNAYTPTQVLETATYINENYTDGLIDNGYLDCPTED
ncbi:MAG TPA: hypothetical protein VGD17_19020 [Chitinophagaceae bacterium]